MIYLQELEKKKKVENAKSAKEKAALEKKRKAEAERLRKEREAKAEAERIANMTPEEKAEWERKKAEKLARERAKEEAIRQEKIRLERIKKRKFPMDDFELMAEDEELRVKPPAESRNFPKMPYVMQAVIPHDARTGGRVADSIRGASQVNNLEDGSRGLISDMMQVFHFFNGAVGYARANPDVVPPFTLTNLLYAADEIMKGNSKVARALPPLISHLFVVSLRILTKSNGHKGSIIGDEREDEEGLSPEENRLRDDLLKLGEGLNVISWPAICTYYMDAMERFFTTDASSDDNFLPNKVHFSADQFEPDAEGDEDAEVDGEESSDEEEVEPMQLDDEDAEDGGLPDGYSAYLGSPGCSLYKAFDKLSRSEPWNLTAEDVFALLRALTDDILSNDPELGRKINDGGSELYELRKQKRFADIHLKRVRNAIKDKERKEAAAEASEKAAAEKKEKEEAEKKDGDEDGGGDTKKEEETGDKKLASAEPAEAEPPKKDEDDEKPSAKDDDGDEKKKKRVGAKKWAVPKATQRELVSFAAALVVLGVLYLWTEFIIYLFAFLTGVSCQTITPHHLSDCRTLPRRMPRGKMKRTKRPLRRSLSGPIRLGTTDTRIPSSSSTTIPIGSTSRSQRMLLPRTTLIRPSRISPRHGSQSTPSLSLIPTSNVSTIVVSAKMILATS